MLRRIRKWLFVSAVLIIGVIIPAGFMAWLTGIQLPSIDPNEPFGMSTSAWERIAKIGGAIFTLVTWTFTASRLWYFADRQLPERLNDFIEKCRQTSLDDRNELALALEEKWVQQFRNRQNDSPKTKVQRRAKLSEWLAILNSEGSQPDGLLRNL